MYGNISFGLGKSPIIIIAPHGPDDIRTIDISKILIDKNKAYYIINNVWKKAKYVNENKYEADCNNINHLYTKTLQQEFLNPYVYMTSRISTNKKFDIYPNHNDCFLFTIHGLDNKPGNPEIILGCGSDSSPCCSEWFANLLYHKMNEHFDCYLGDPKGSYSASSINNFCQWASSMQTGFQIVQIEINFNLRQLNNYKNTAQKISDIISNVTLTKNYNPELLIKKATKIF